MDVSVVIATYNRRALLHKLLEKWEKVNIATKYKYELIFSDDGSTDSSVEFLRNYKSLPIIVLENEHGGAGKTRNAAVKEAKGKIVIFTGDDIYPEPDFINFHYESFLKNGEMVATLGKIEWENGTVDNHLMKHITEIGCEQFSFAVMKPYEIVDFRHFYTSNVSVAKSLLDNEEFVFNALFSGYGFEDIELGYRLYKNGVKILYNPDIIVYHDHVYSSINKFCERQYSSGQMLNVFKDVHPELSIDEIKFDIDGFYDSFQNYINQKSNPVTDYLFYYLVVVAKVGAYFLERILKYCNILKLQKICSLIYHLIFNFNLYLGITSKYDFSISKRRKFCGKYIFYGYTQVFYSNDTNFTQEQSIKIKTVGSKRIFTNITIPMNDCYAFGLEPYSKNCFYNIKNIEVIFDDGSKEMLMVSENNKMMYFNKLEESIPIIRKFEKPIKELSCYMDIKYLRFRNILNTLKNYI